MPKPISKPMPAADLVRQLRQRILTGDLAAGERLLPERRLVAVLGCSLHHLRLALRQLHTEGLLVSRRRSGVQVAATVLPPNTAAGPGSTEGFHMFDVLARPHSRLRFLVSAWSPANRPTWETICRSYALAHPEVEIEPFFPTSREQYSTLYSGADLFITTPSVLGHSRQVREIRLLPGDALAGAPLASRYTLAARAGTDGRLLGVPFAGTLFTGLLNRTQCGESLLSSLKSAGTFTAAINELLAAAPEGREVGPLNLSATQTFNLFQLGHLLCGGWFEKQANGHFRFAAAPVRRILDVATAIRAHLPPPQPNDTIGHRPGSCVAFLQFTYALVPHFASPHLIPWLFPVDPQGSTIEGINVGAMRQDCPYPELATAFLLHLLSDEVQQRLAQLPGEYPLSRRIAQPFQGYPVPWRQVLAAQQERAWVMADVFPGYFEFVIGVLFPLARRFFAGSLDSATMTAELEQRSRRFLRNR